MKTISENDQDFICDIQAPCFQMLQPHEAELVRSSKTQVLFRREDNLTKQGAFASYVLFIITGRAGTLTCGLSGRGNLLVFRLYSTKTRSVTLPLH
jgi:hypothetical protein